MTVAVLVVNWNAGALLARCLQSLARQTPAARSHRRRRQRQQRRLARPGSAVSRRRGGHPPYRERRVCPGQQHRRPRRGRCRRAGAPESGCVCGARRGWRRSSTPPHDRPGFAAFASQMRLDAAPDRLDGAGDSYHVSGRAWRNGHNAPAATWPAGEYEVFAPCAAAALYRRAAFEEVGGFDERYFCYFEDVDLGFRLRLRGHRCLYVPASVVRHVSSALSGYRSDFAVYHGERNMRLDVRQEHAGAAVLALPAAAPGAQRGVARSSIPCAGRAAWSGGPSAMRCAG